MVRLKWTNTLFLTGSISAILLYFFSRIDGFPKEVMVVFFPADYFWLELRDAASRGMLRKVISNVAVFGLLAGAEGALIGLMLDFYQASRRLSLNRRVKYLRRSAGKMDLAFKRCVQELLTKHDPAGLVKAGQVEDAYGSEADVILVKLRRLRSGRGLGKFCRQHFRREFGSQVKKFKEYDCLAKEIWASYLRHRSEAKREGPFTKGM